MSAELFNFTQRELPNMTTTDSGVSVAPALPVQSSLFWADASTVVLIVGVSLVVPGMLGNFLMYKAANFMPKSNNSVFMKHLAIWDSVHLIGLAELPVQRLMKTKPLLDRSVSSRFKCNWAKRKPKYNHFRPSIGKNGRSF